MCCLHVLSVCAAAVEIVLESDLVDSCKPGDRVAIVGIFRPLASSGSGGSTSGAYRCAAASRSNMQQGIM
jgi:DNA replicative helicase MCM subunit Mcm2 (Cdc46/Mcm family)